MLQTRACCRKCATAPPGVTIFRWVAEFGVTPGQFASAQLQDDALKHAWSHVLAHDRQTRDSVSNLPHPHFSTRGALLYRVVEKDGGVTGTISGTPGLR